MLLGRAGLVLWVLFLESENKFKPDFSKVKVSTFPSPKYSGLKNFRKPKKNLLYKPYANTGADHYGSTQPYFRDQEVTDTRGLVGLPASNPWDRRALSPIHPNTHILYTRAQLLRHAPPRRTP